MTQKEKEQCYLSAFNQLKSATSVSDYFEIIRLLEQCEGFMDADELLLQCRKVLTNLKQEDLYKTAVTLSNKRDRVSLARAAEFLEELNGYKDAPALLTKVRRELQYLSEVPADISSRVCPSCGQKNKEENRFCSKCGAPLVSSFSSTPIKKSNRSLILGLGAAALVLLLVVAGILLFNHSKNSSDFSEYEGFYQDYFKDSDIPSTEIKITSRNDGTYHIELFIYKLIYLDDIIGTPETDHLAFEGIIDSLGTITGEIMLEGDTLTVTVEDSAFDYINAGETMYLERVKTPYYLAP